jgi:hypothetical protein
MIHLIQGAATAVLIALLFSLSVTTGNTKELNEWRIRASNLETLSLELQQDIKEARFKSHADGIDFILDNVDLDIDELVEFEVHQ